MLYGSDRIVLFYEDFKPSYSYTKIGRVDHPESLTETLGNDTITVTFKIK